jgi:hypothetical protein
VTKPEPTPTLKGKDAKAFLKQIKEPPTEKQKAIFVEADRVYDAIQRKDKEGVKK